MKPDREQKSSFSERKISSGSADDSSDAVQYSTYDRILRSLGSMLEQEGLVEFELRAILSKKFPRIVVAGKNFCLG